MNETPPPSGAAPSGAPQNAPFGAGFFTWIRGLGIGRGGDRWFAGVAGGIAMRAGIDPIIVRGIFVVLAVLGGPGIVLYLAGWLLLPDQGGRIHLEEVFRGRAGTAAVVATVAVGVFVVLPVFFRVLGITAFGGWSLWNSIGVPDWMSTTVAVIVWIGVIAALGFLVSRIVLQHGRKVREEAAPAQAFAPPAPSTPDAPQPHEFAAGFPSAGQPTTVASPTSAPGTHHAGTAPTTDPTAPTATAPSQDWTQRLTAGAERAGEQAARWGEDVGKQADDWSARYAEQHELTKLGAAHVVITLALALLAAGGAALVTFDMQLNSGLVLTAALLGATAVLAVSLIVAGIRGRRTGWVGFLATCGVLALLFTSVLPTGSKFQPFGTVEVSETAPATVLLAGKSDLDLTALDASGGTHNLDVWHLAGKSVVTLPAEEPVVLTVRLLAGSVDASAVTQDTSSVAGPLLSRTIDTRVNDSEEATRVTVYMLAGSVHVQDAPNASPRDRGERSRDTNSVPYAELGEELGELREQAGELRGELKEPGISEVREERLQNTLDFTLDEIEKLEKELAR
ncbi:MAG: PspC domain-containing protein [Leucobacter sp.]|nr:PspC domain-containing protein [Leucobacter sp.]